MYVVCGCMHYARLHFALYCLVAIFFSCVFYLPIFMGYFSKIFFLVFFHSAHFFVGELRLYFVFAYRNNSVQHYGQ